MNTPQSSDDENAPADNRQSAPAVPDHIVAAHLADEPVVGTERTDTPTDTMEVETTEEVPAATEPIAVEEDQKSTIVTGSGQNVFHRFTFWLSGHKRIGYPLIILIILALVLGIPFTRYKALGLVMKKDYAVIVLDETTKQPVTNATVELAGQKSKTDNKGKATLKVPVGPHALSVEKKYYRSTDGKVLVDIFGSTDAFRVFVKATGRQVPIVVLDKISGKPVENALIRAEGSEARTSKAGEATLVLPADKTTVDSRINLENYNNSRVSVTVTDQTTDKNTFKLTPSGKLYFLSKLSGKIDVVKTNLDGSDRQTVLAGTSNESNTETILLASRDWKYLAFKSKRTNESAKMYVIDTATDKLTIVDEGNATFTPVGWSGNRFIYVTYRTNVKNWEPYAQALKSYDATTGKLAILDQTAGEGSGQYDYAYSWFSAAYILNNELVYAKNWSSNYSLPNRLDGKNVSLVSAKPDGTGKKTIREFAIPAGTQYGYSIELSLYAPGELYVRSYSGSTATYYEYENGKIAAKSGVTDQQFYNESYPTYLIAPDDTQAFWSESRDGKNTLFVGDAAGQNGKQIATLSPYTAYGWYSNRYLLVSKNASELFIMPVAGGAAVKVTDYHKPGYDFRGYGYGYGGL